MADPYKDQYFFRLDNLEAVEEEFWKKAYDKFVAWYASDDDWDSKRTLVKLSAWLGHLACLKEEDASIAAKRVERFLAKLEGLEASYRQNMIALLAHDGGETCSQRALMALTKYEAALLSGHPVHTDTLPIQISQLLGQEKI